MLISYLRLTQADVAQSVAHLIGSEEVTSSILVISSISGKSCWIRIFRFLFSAGGGHPIGIYTVRRGCYNKAVLCNITQNEEQTMGKIYDTIIIGAGPAGLAAGIYAGRARLSTLIIEKGQDGGQIATTSDIENYPGQLPAGEPGTRRATHMAPQCAPLGCERAYDWVQQIEPDGSVKKVVGANAVYEGKTVIIASGAYPRPIGCEGEAEFRGRGVSYCATCDANFFRGLEVFVVGGGDAAVEEAVFLTRFARSVTVIHRRNELRAARSIQEKAFANEKLHFLWDSVVTSLAGDGVLQKITVKNVKTGEETVLEAEEKDGMFGLFGFIGTVPNTEVFAGTGIETDENGYILTDEEMRTSVPGVFAAGDVRRKSLRQVITAAADGAVAAVQAEKYLS